MFTPEFNYTHSIVRNLMVIEGAKEVIENSPILPIWQSRLQKDALVRQAHHTTRIEGTQLTIDQVRDLIDEKPVVAKERDIQEVRNYLKVAAFIDEVYGNPDMELDLRTIRHIHYLTLDGFDKSRYPNGSWQFLPMSKNMDGLPIKNYNNSLISHILLPIKN